MRKEMTTDEALSRAQALCSRSEHSTGEMMRKLLQWGISRDASEGIVDALVDDRYIDNARFARAYANDKLRYNSWGRIKIAQGLRISGVDDRDIRQALDDLDPDEYQQVLLTVLQRKSRSLNGEEDDYTRQGKLIRHALSHGFEMDLVLKNL